MPPAEPVAPAEAQAVRDLAAAYSQMTGQIGKVIVGQNEVVEQLLMALFSRGHCLLVGVPGLAKTLMIRTLADSLNLSFSRIQFTPDLMPSDITGTEVLQEDKATGQRVFKFLHGPLFANVVLADEINRTPPKTQAALLESMQERQVTVGGTRHKLPDPFFVLATQNPIEQEGTYPLPEAQVDRFMLKVKLTYPSKEEELAILNRMAAVEARVAAEPVLSADDVFDLRRAIDAVHVDDKVKRYIVDVVHATRNPGEYGLDIGPYVQYGASPRATIFLTRGARAQAFLEGRGYVTPQDVKSVGYDVLRHRVSVTYEAEAEDLSSDHLLKRVFDHLKVP